MNITLKRKLLLDKYKDEKAINITRKHRIKIEKTKPIKMDKMFNKIYSGGFLAFNEAKNRKSFIDKWSSKIIQHLQQLLQIAA